MKQPKIREWQLLTKKQFDQIDPTQVIVSLTCSPFEVHGPHLPMCTDVTEGEGLSRRAIELVSERNPDFEFLTLPPIYVATDALPQRGSLQFQMSTVISVLSDLGRTLAAQGFKNIWVSGFHGGPRHFVAVETAAAHCNDAYGTRMISTFSMMLSDLTAGGYDLSKVLEEIPNIPTGSLVDDTHAGFLETSMMLHLLEKYVDPEFSKLPRKTITTQTGNVDFFTKVKSFIDTMKYYETETYSGTPGVATAEHGKAILELLAKKSSVALEDVLFGRRSPADCHSPIWASRHLFQSPIVSNVLEKVIGYKTEVF